MNFLTELSFDYTLVNIVLDPLVNFIPLFNPSCIGQNLIQMKDLKS